MVCLGCLLFWISAFTCLSLQQHSPHCSSVPLFQVQLTEGVEVLWRQCVPWEGGDMPDRSGALCCDTAGSCRGSAEQSRFQAAESPAGSCLHGSAACLHCTEVLCSLFVSFKACLLGCQGSAVRPRTWTISSDVMLRQVLEWKCNQNRNQKPK